MDDQGWTICKCCARRSLLKSAFTEVYSFAGPAQLCPHCAERRRVKRARAWGWGTGAVTLVLVSLIAAGIYHHVFVFFLVYAGIAAAMYLSVLPHEFGHALTAAAVGYKPLAIMWGSTNIRVDRRVFGIRMMIGEAPQGGVTFFDPVNDTWPRLKQAAVTAAGPLTNLLMAALAWAAYGLIDPVEHLALRSGLMAFALGNILLCLGNLWPAPTITLAGTVPNDGLQLLDLLRGKTVLDLAARRAAACHLRAYLAFLDDDLERMLLEADRAETLKGPSLAIEVTRSAALCQLGRPSQARETLLRGIELPGADPASQVLAQNNLAWANFLIDDVANDHQSLERSSRAMEAMPWLAPIVITRACVLAAYAGTTDQRLAEARGLLAGLGDFTLDRRSSRFAAIARGLIAASAGEFEKARNELEVARSLGDPGLAARVLEARIPSR
jgi:hypothetical protein